MIGARRVITLRVDAKLMGDIKRGIKLSRDKEVNLSVFIRKAIRFYVASLEKGA